MSHESLAYRKIIFISSKETFWSSAENKNINQEE